MPRLESSRDAIGAVDHPETGELIQLNEDHPRDVCEAVADAYHYLSVDGDEPETFWCGVEKANGNPCEREVDSESATCWQH